MTIDVDLAGDDVAVVFGLAQASLEYAKRMTPKYPNTIQSHFVGKLGEVAAEAWARDHGTWEDSPFRSLDRSAEADVIAGGRRLEIKTWSAVHWKDVGRCMTPGQLRFPSSRTDAVVWCSVDRYSIPPDGFDVAVRIEGWSSVDDIERTPIVVTGPPHNRIRNHQLALGEIRPMDEL